MDNIQKSNVAPKKYGSCPKAIPFYSWRIWRVDSPDTKALTTMMVFSTPTKYVSADPFVPHSDEQTLFLVLIFPHVISKSHHRKNMVHAERLFTHIHGESGGNLKEDLSFFLPAFWGYL